MNLEEKILATLSPIVPAISPNKYAGDSDEYIVFSYNERSALNADDDEQETSHSVRVDYVLPHGINPNDKNRRIKQALKSISETSIDITNASEDMFHHYVFDFSMLREN